MGTSAYDLYVKSEFIRGREMTTFAEAIDAFESGKLVTWKMLSLERCPQTGTYKLKSQIDGYLWTIPPKVMKEDEWIIGRFRQAHEI